jgi:hypothetical protein
MTMRVSPLPAPALQVAQPATPHPHRRAIAVGLVGFGLLALSAAALPSTAASAPASAPIAASVPEAAAVSLSVPTDQNAVGLGCWVTGDLVWSPEGTSKGDPADIVRAACGGR